MRGGGGGGGGVMWFYPEAWQTQNLHTVNILYVSTAYCLVYNNTVE